MPAAATATTSQTRTWTCLGTPQEVRVRAKALQEALMKAFVAERRAEILASLPSFAPYRRA